MFPARIISMQDFQELVETSAQRLKVMILLLRFSKKTCILALAALAQDKDQVPEVAQDQAPEVAQDHLQEADLHQALTQVPTLMLSHKSTMITLPISTLTSAQSSESARVMHTSATHQLRVMTSLYRFLSRMSTPTESHSRPRLSTGNRTTMDTTLEPLPVS